MNTAIERSFPENIFAFSGGKSVFSEIFKIVCRLRYLPIRGIPYS
jgi:hypothetical protein